MFLGNHRARFMAVLLAAGLILPVAAVASTYGVENQWGGNAAPWNAGGSWTLGEHPITMLQITSGDGGRTFTGTMRYRGGPVGVFQATSVGDNNYNVEIRWGGVQHSQVRNGTWVIGGRPNQRVVSVDVRSSDNGRTLQGTMTYMGEGPIGFRGTSH